MGPDLPPELVVEKVFGTDWGYVVEHYFKQYFTYIVAVSFIGGWNRSTRRKLPTYLRTECILCTFIWLYKCIQA